MVNVDNLNVSTPRTQLIGRTGDPLLEQELAGRIDRWLQHMRWRTDFDQWRAGRIWQENHQDERVTAVERYGGALAGRRILEVGSGMGGACVALALRGAYPVASEFNHDYCQIARLRAARYDLPLPVINATGEQMPFAPRSFELAVCWDVVEHVQNPDELLAELGRVLRPGGRVFLTIINRFAWRDPHYHIVAINYLPRPVAEAIIRWRRRSKVGSAFQDKQRLSEMHYFTYRQFRRVAHRHGFQVFDIREDHVYRGKGTATGLKGKARDALRRLGVALPAYRVYRALVQGTYELVLVRDADDQRLDGAVPRRAPQSR